MLSISTAWNAGTTSGVNEMLSGIKKAGFKAIEVGYGFSPEKLEELRSLAGAMGIRIVSVHNYCPLPSSSPKRNKHTAYYYSFSSQDKEERKSAVENTKLTIDTAKWLSAEAVVIHAGTVELKQDYAGRLMRLYRENKRDSGEYNAVKEEFLKARQENKKPYVDSVAESLDKVLSYAVKAGIKIGLETRYYPHEIPDFGEIGYFLKLSHGKGLYYWHDAGHAEVNERLGIMPHSAFLESYSDNLLGMHIHDLTGTDDHKAPFTGDLDFSKIKPYLARTPLKVIEAHYDAASAGMTEADIAMKLNGE